MANISPKLDKIGHYFQISVQKLQQKEKEIKSLFDKFKVADQEQKIKLKMEIKRVYGEYMDLQDTHQKIQNSFEKQLNSEPAGQFENGTQVVEDKGTVGDESGMAIAQLKDGLQNGVNVLKIFQSKGDMFDVPAWVQSYLALASDYLHSINEYYKGNKEAE